MSKETIAIFWSLTDRIGIQIVSFIIGVILARLLIPEDYGLIGISSVFIAFSNLFIDSGFANALIRKLDRTEEDLSTAFFFNIAMGTIIYSALFFAAPLIASAFESTKLVNLVRIVGLNILFNSLCIVQIAILTANLKIKEQSIINISAQVPSGILAIYLAYCGYGVYALAVQSLGNSLLRTLVLWFYAKWRPICVFSKSSMRYLWGFGSKLMVANFIGVFFNELYTIIIGKFIGKEDLGYYSKAKSLSSQPDVIFTGIIQKVSIPIFARLQTDINLLKDKYRTFTKVIFCMMGLVTCILISVATPLIDFLWGNTWSLAVMPFQILLISSLFSPPTTLNLCLLEVLNKTSFTLKLEFIKKPIYLVVIIIGSFYGFQGLLIAQVIVSVIAILVNMSASKRYIYYSYKEQIKDIIVYIILVALCVIISLFVMSYVKYSNIINCIIGSIFCCTLYFLILIIIKDEVYTNYIKPYILKTINKYKNKNE